MTRALRIAALALACLGSACSSDEKGKPPCVGGFAVGQTLQVRLGMPYDAKGDYWWDGTLQPFDIGPSTPSCASSDGWETGAVLSWVIAEPLFVGEGTCHPWRADLDPAVLADARLVVQRHPQIPKQTIAASFEQGTRDGQSLFFIRGLYTPSEDFRGPLVSKQRPPLVVTRRMVRDNDWIGGCYDAWIASWEGIPCRDGRGRIQVERRSGEFFAPLPLAAVALLVVNDTCLKPAFHNALTGKLSDVAVCFFLPLFVSELLGILFRVDLRGRLLVGAAATTILFTALEIVPPVTQLALRALTMIGPHIGIGRRFQMTADWTDLFCLAVIPLAVAYGRLRFGFAALSGAS